MKKRYLMLIPVAACVIACAAAVGYIRFHPEQAPEGTPFLLEQAQAQPQQESGSGEQPEPQQESEPQLSAEQKRAQEILDGMTLDQKIYQMMFVRPETLMHVRRVQRAGEATQRAIEERPVGGILYSSDNFRSTSQTSEMLSSTQDYARQAGAKIPLFTGVEEEGGSAAGVASRLNTTAFEDMAEYGEQNDPQQAYEIGKTIAADISGLGFNVDFAPVADLLLNENNREIGARSFGSDPAAVSAMVENEVKGLQENGVMSVLKHFPGTGSTNSSSHDDAAQTGRRLEQLRTHDLKPFQAGMAQNAAFVLVSHMTAAEVDSVPCSLSKKVVTDLLRDELGYNGIAMTDSLDLRSITRAYSNDDAVVQAVAAGEDMLLCPPSIEEAYDALTAAVADGTIPESRIDESVLRILTAKLQYGLMN